MRFMLDTNICIELLRGRAAGLFARLRRQPVDAVGISSITLAELQYGVARSASPERNALLLAEFCAPLDIAPFDAPASEIYGRLRADLERHGRPIGPLDTLIAAHALSVNATLLTNNRREFSRVPGLHVEDWRTE